MLEDLEARNSEMAKAGLRDKFDVRGYYLHIHGYHEETLSYVEVEEELRKAEEYIRDVEKILKTLFTLINYQVRVLVERDLESKFNTRTASCV